MRRQQRRTVSISVADRGQTTQDFAVGIGVFLLAVAFVFVFVPTLLSPFSASAGGSADAAQADRVAATVLENLTDDPERSNRLNVTAFYDEYGDASDEELARKLGLRSTDAGVPIDHVAIRLEPLDESDPVTYGPGAGAGATPGDNVSAGATYADGTAAASAARIVTVDDGVVDSDACDPACRLVVRVW